MLVKLSIGDDDKKNANNNNGSSHFVALNPAAKKLLQHAVKTNHHYSVRVLPTRVLSTTADENGFSTMIDRQPYAEMRMFGTLFTVLTIVVTGGVLYYYLVSTTGIPTEISDEVRDKFRTVFEWTQNVAEKLKQLVQDALNKNDEDDIVLKKDQLDEPPTPPPHPPTTVVEEPFQPNKNDDEF